MKKQLTLAVLVAAALLAVSGCTNTGTTEIGTAESGTNEIDEQVAPVAADFWDEFEGVVDQTETGVTVSRVAIDLRLVIKTGQQQNYRLTNDITSVAQSQYDADVTLETTSFLYADQSVYVDDIKNFYIVTTGVEGGVEGDGMGASIADIYMQATVQEIEGSILVAGYDEKGSGKNIMLIEGSGLNPLGAQTGSQGSVMGFMGVLLPGGEVKPGDSWDGVYDISQIAAEVFKGKGARTTTDTIPLTYVLRGYDKTRGLAQIGIFGSGSSVVDLTVDSVSTLIALEVKIEGEALVRLSDGWLHELRVQTEFVTEGFVATQQTVKTVIKAVPAPKDSS